MKAIGLVLVLLLFQIPASYMEVNARWFVIPPKVSRL